MITTHINSNLDDLSDRLSNMDKDAMIRDVALSVLPMIRKRVHVEGEASDGSQIGSYTKGYLVVRSGQFQNNRKKHGEGFVKAGGQKGQYTKGNKTGKKRAYYNRGTDRKVVLSLTRQMEDDLSVIPIDDGYGIGYNNPDNFKKAIWNETRYKKSIWNLSEEELKTVDRVVNDHLSKALNG